MILITVVILQKNPKHFWGDMWNKRYSIYYLNLRVLYLSLNKMLYQEANAKSLTVNGRHL